jgi:hypothetical protein
MEPTSFIKPDGCVRFVQFPFGVLISVYICGLFGFYEFDIHGSVHRNDSVEIPRRCCFVIEYIIPKFIEGLTCFERHTAHYQELYSFPTQPCQRPAATWVYKPEAANTV